MTKGCCKPTTTSTVICPTCGSRLTGYVGEMRYFCRDCYTEFKFGKKSIHVYDIHREGIATAREEKVKHVVKEKYRGVSANRNKTRWYAEIRHNGKREYLGSFVTDKDAARAYNQRAIELLGKDARLNDIGE